MIEQDLGVTSTIEFEDHIIIGLDKRFLKFNDGKPIEFLAKINEYGKIVLESQALTKLSNTGVDNRVKL